MFDHANRLGVYTHRKQMLELLAKISGSEYLSFLVKLRPKFMQCVEKYMEKYADFFTDMDREAFWLSTAVHSLDHSQLYVSWLTSDDLKCCGVV